MCHCALSVAHLFEKSSIWRNIGFELATELNPNDVTVLGFRSKIEMFASRPEQTLRFMDMALRLKSIAAELVSGVSRDNVLHATPIRGCGASVQARDGQAALCLSFPCCLLARMNRLDQARALRRNR